MDLMTADFVVEWQLAGKSIGSDVPLLDTSDGDAVVIPEWTPVPEADPLARRGVPAG